MRMVVELRSVQCLALGLGIVSLLALHWTGKAWGAEMDPKAACRTEEVIINLAGVPPDRLDFLGERQGSNRFRCEAYFSFSVYDEVWTRLSDLAKSLRDVEAICVTNGLAKLPRTNALQMEYVINAGGQLQITTVSDGLPTNPQKLSQRLRSDIKRLEQIRDADDKALLNEFARRNCPEAGYPVDMQQ